jgi:predicted nucleotidyltransferase/HEPN domain-containing protein
MKKSLKHLPQNKQDELQKIVSAIQKSCKDVEKIILFGSYARGDYKEKKDLKPQQKTGHISDYDVLVVTEKKETTDEFVSWSGAEKLKLSAPVRVIAHDIQSLNISLAEGQYLFTDIKKEGVILYDSKKYKLANKRKLKPEEKQRIAKDYFEHWFKKSRLFFRDYVSNLEESSKDRSFLAQAAFHLHQAAEHSYKTTLLVFTNYNPQEHYLGILGRMTVKYHPELISIFPKKTQKEKDRFKLLEYAYIGGRYDPSYRISKEDLEILSKDVKKLLDITQEICAAKVKSFIEK